MSVGRILVVGLSAAGAAGLPVALLERIARADLLAGGRRQLGYFPDFNGERLLIAAEIAPVAERLGAVLEEGRRAVVLASGDPLWYGVGASLRRFFPAEALEIIPAPASFQLAFAALGEPWDGAALLSAHARPLADVVAAMRTARRAAILTDPRHTPAAVARALLDDGHPPDAPSAVCENLGAPEQRILRQTLAQTAAGEHAPLNIFVVLQTARAEQPARRPRPSPIKSLRLCASAPLRFRAPGLPDELFATEGGQITKREVRLLSLAELALGPGETLWDIGAGSGSVAIEAARAQPTAAVYAVERRAVFVGHIRENLRRAPAPNVTVAQGDAPEACADWPDPDAVFVGGSGGRLAAIVAQARARLRPGGRLVLNLVTLEHLLELRALLPDARVTQVQISRGVPIQDMLRFEALNPVFIAVWRKPNA
ncbi:MAG TPA: precorrin-6y C5,15-methyltransferase (decarboxylating) subunit CbiE [Roseiflexaceae bacterium]|nr:precorrin-6y C5,15-methyltransferase (decarboxylating) subunit CbiE [Roseiflexaceae bacterium]